MKDNTIVALSTPPGRGAIAVVRMSGGRAKEIAGKIFSSMPKEPNTLKVGKISLDGFSDRAMLVFFDAPRSYTGEDTVEFHCHGGAGVAGELIRKCISLGARTAVNGEFSKRAFLNGKQNLSNAEGIIQMIDAESRLALKAGENLMSGRLGKLTAKIQDELTDVIAECEAALDYPEEDLDVLSRGQIYCKLSEIYGSLNRLAFSAETGRIISGGVNIAIVGNTNVGKSSLLNALLGSERAIVTDIAGTTRDTLKESIIFKDAKFNFIDTAGLRKTEDYVEKLGIDRAQRAAEQADLVLNVVEGGGETVKTDKPVIIVRNKMDKIKTDGICLKENEIWVSALYGTNIEELKQKIYDKFSLGSVGQDDTILTNARHADCVENAKRFVKNALDALDITTLDCVTAEVRNAWNTLGLITGATASEEIIDRIYEKFCLGK